MRTGITSASAVLFLMMAVPMPSFATESSVTAGLMPMPASITRNVGGFLISTSFNVGITGSSSPRLERGVARLLSRLEDKTGVQLPKEIRHDLNSTLIVNVRSEGPVIEALNNDESYSLTSTATSVRIEAPTTDGALHALETLLQLLEPDAHGYVIPAVVISDAPRFPWRGLMIDCSRHFEPMEVLKRNIDAMAAVKLNVFHWHLTDDQGFRIESKRYPKLTQVGSDGLFYTQEQARELVQYARDRGIRVVPEFEMPGHSTAWLVAYPELSSGSAPVAIRREFGVSSFVLDPTREETYRFLEGFLAEMATVFPDQYVHIGGDEAPAPDWKTNPRILAFKKDHGLSDNDALQAYFNQRVMTILLKLHRRMVGWDEIFNPGLPKDVVVQSWRGEESLAKGATQGYQGILSAPYYLDGMKPASTHYLADPVPRETTLTPEQQKKILGGEVCMWGEHLDQRTIDSRIWPRTAAVAERFWSKQEVRDPDDMYRRLASVSLELEQLGVRHLSSEDAGLRELAGREDIEMLRTFATAFEPVSFGERVQQQHTSQLTPLTSFVDAVQPDPPARHAIQRTTTQFLATGGQQTRDSVEAGEALLRFFDSVGASVPEVEKLMETSPRLATLRTRAEQLAELTLIGKQAIEFRKTGSVPSAAWTEQGLATIAAARKPGEMVQFNFLAPLTELVTAAR